MTEHTDKAPEKSGKKPPAKRGGKARAPGGKQAKRPGSKTAASSAAESKTFDPNYPGPKAMAPDPATITFGSNRPIVAAPPKLPESSGLKFAGLSAGELKASGPQPTSPKASGLTFTSAKSGPAPKAAAKPASASGTNVLTTDAPQQPVAAGPAKPTVAKASEGKTEARKPDIRKPEVKTGDTNKAGLTKPAIAPPVTLRRFDKERSTGGFVALLLVLTLIGGGLAFWLKLGSETLPAGTGAPQQAVHQGPQQTPQQTPQQAEVRPAAPPAAAPAPAAEPEAPTRYGSSVRAPETSGPLAAGPAESARDGLTAAEIAEIQRLLSRLDFNPGSETGVVTAGTVAAIRSYQEMAGLPADGEATAALLEELRSVVELYGG